MFFMHAKKYAVLCRRRLGKTLMALFLLLGLITAFVGPIQTVHADDTPTSMDDVAAHYANAGFTWANTDPSDSKTYNAHAIVPWQKTYTIWNFLGPGKNSILSKESVAQKGGTYDALKSNVPNEVAGNVEDAAKYSFAMYQSGLDHPTIGKTDFLHKLGRYILAISSVIMMYISYLGSNIIHVIFKLFKWVNVFYAMRFVSTNEKLANSAFSGIVLLIKPIYQILRKITIGMLITSFVGSVLMAFIGFRQQGHQEGIGTTIAMKFLKKCTQIAAIVAMPLVIGELSSDLTGFLEDSFDVTSNITLTEIYGNYVNFGGWANHSRLALPNKATLGKDLNVTNQLNSSGNNAFSEDYINAINAYGAGMTVPAKLMTTHKASMSDVNSTANFLWRYMNAGSMSGSDWNGTFQARLRKKIRGIKGDTIKQQAQGANAQNPSVGKQDALKNPYLAIYNEVFGDYGKNGGNYDHAMNLIFFSDGSLDSYKGKDGHTYYKSNAPLKADPSDVAAIGSPKEAGLSSIGLYNYLNVDGSSGSQLKYTEPGSLHTNDFVQHTNEGFIGRGFMAIGSFFKMLAIIATSGLVVAFIGMIVIEGVLRNIPYIFVYLLKCVSGQWSAIISVIQELIDLYTRVLVGSFIVYLFQGIIPTLCTSIEGFFMKAMPASGIYLGKVNLMPYANLNSGSLGLVRVCEAAAIFFIMRAILRSYRDILKWINSLIKGIVDRLRKTTLGRMALPATPAPAMPGMNSMNNTNANNANQMNSDGYNNDDKPFDPDHPDTGDDIKNRERDPEQNYGQKTSSKGFAKQSALMGLDALDALDNSQAGKALKKGAAALGGAVAGSKLGEALHMKGRGEGQQALQKAENRFRQSMAMAADPVHANNTAKAGMSTAEKKATDAQEKHAQQMASPAALAQAKRDQQAQKQAKQDIVDKFKDAGVDEKGRPVSELKDPKDVKDVVEAMKAQDALSPKAQAATRQMTDLATKDYQQAQRRTKNLENAVAQAQQAYEQDASPDNEKRLKRAQNALKKAQVISDPNKRAMFEHANNRAATTNGVGLKAATAKQMSTARKRQFTALTGKDANSAIDATPEQLAKAQAAATNAKAVLADPDASQAKREQAAQALQEANVVLQTKKQFGSYATPEAAANLQTASGDAIKAAKQYQQVDQATIATQVVATSDAPKMTAPEMVYAKKLDNARQVIETGQIMDQGQERLATATELARAQRTLTSDPAKQVRRIQAKIMSTTSTVMAQARSYGDQAVVGVSSNVGPTEVAHMREQAINRYLEKPAVQQELRETGLVNTRNPQALQEQIVQVQKLDQQMRDGLNASLAPIRAQIKNTPSMPDRMAIKQAGENQFNRLYASSRIVDEVHYETTTNKQIRHATQELLNAYHTKDPEQIKVARAKASAIGMANPYINSQKRLQELDHTMREQKNNIVSNAVGLNGSVSDYMGDIAEHMNDYGEAMPSAS